MTDLPKTASGFEALMQAVWECPTVNEVVTADWDYDLHHNAVRTAEMCGAVRTGEFIRDYELWEEWRFPDGGLMWISADGGSVDPNKPRPCNWISTATH